MSTDQKRGSDIEISSPVNEAKRLLLERSCKNCNIHQAIIKTAHLATHSGALSLNIDSDDRLIFIEALYPLLQKKGCRMSLHFDGGVLKPIFPKKGYCSKWLSMKEDTTPTKIV